MPPAAPLLVLVLLRGCWGAVELHSAAGQHRSGLLPLTPLVTVPEGPAMARRAHCLARCVRRTDRVSFNYGRLPDGSGGCQLLGGALCQAGGAFSTLQRDEGAHYFDLYRGEAVGSREVRGQTGRPGRSRPPDRGPLGQGSAALGQVSAALGQGPRSWDRVRGAGTGSAELGQGSRRWDRVRGAGTGFAALGQSPRRCCRVLIYTDRLPAYWGIHES